MAYTHKHKDIGDIYQHYGKWSSKHKKTLASLFKDYQTEANDNETTFQEFSIRMYRECNHPRS